MTELAARLHATEVLANALRQLNAVAALTEVSESELHAAARSAERLTEQLGHRLRQFPSLPLIDDLAEGIRNFNPVTGRGSPVSFPMGIDPAVADSVASVGRVTLGPNHEGHVGIAHGGILALLFDEILGSSASRKVWPSVTRNLSVTYLRPVPVGVPLVLNADVHAIEGRALTVHGTIALEEDPQKSLATAQGSLVELSIEQSRRILGSTLQRVGGVVRMAQAADGT
ncbi:PaaI family thioesterase [Rhodococcus qingshengii]|uniref:PaaI family thioesterase n=1 Tax=Rhodococcus qingshengii TaxID=334542 RepID=UPI00237CEC18|nr:PaaI family thioesterase [Rhodococcus qingshengii]WCT05784.1 PaaI family thioesterase [Rhodococcus qingshengii]